ncbi:hypothetical protein PoB_001844600 [Plakobranchus ocellatus]|uniref:Uncharacterized protein n=1 Tax=Plakobranchus ocellatus TaxID=259542 RepID=A0AAV3YXX7_9GAST|nr:hypothetical protein PoB_001844600 [Plakobranchus ocellatus]
MTYEILPFQLEPIYPIVTGSVCRVCDGHLAHHPLIMTALRSLDSRHRHSILMLTDETLHDHHAVDTLTRRAISFLQSLLPVRSVRDGCTGPQRKGKNAMAVSCLSYLFSLHTRET